MLPYFARLLCISLAAFYFVHLAAGALVCAAAPAMIRLAERLRARDAARLLLALRMLPAAIATFAVGGLCIPSYLWLEPPATGEGIGLLCLTGAALCIVCCAVAFTRAVRATSRSLGYIRYCEMVGRRTCLGLEASPAWVVEGPAPFLALAGILHARLMVSTAVVNALPPDQLAAALRHEHAHEVSRDNFKRLLLLIAPGLLPGWRGFAAIERAWGRFTEWAADDIAAAGDSARSVSLAGALVRVARMGACPQQPPLVTSLLAETDDLAQRVDRLLSVTPAPSRIRSGKLAALTATSAAVLLGIAMAQPATLHSVHRLMEYLAH
jgi:hypothetical protein